MTIQTRRNLTNFVIGFLAIAAVPIFTTDAAAGDPQGLVDKGRSIATAADCAACHTVPHVGRPFAGGYAIVSPLGIIYSTNITPSKQSGIGDYSEADFERAVRHGIRKDGAHLYPAMPYDSYAEIDDADIHALYAYFSQGVDPVDEPARNTTALPFPFNVRVSMSFWNLLYATKQPFASNPSNSDEINRGAYLAGALGHCGSCHTPRGLLMGAVSGRFLAGGDVGPWYAPNITSDPVSGIGAWSVDELVRYFRNGHVDGKNQAAGGMAEAVQNSLQYLPDSDLHALAIYLRTVPPVRDPKEVGAAFQYGQAASMESQIRGTSGPSEVDSLDSGAKLYSGNCASCHQPDGSGTGNQAYPSLFHNTATGAMQAKNLLATIVYGVDREVDGKAVSMPSFGTGSFANPLSDQQIADVAKYVMVNFGNPAIDVTSADVAAARAGGPVPFLARIQPYVAPGIVGAIILAGISLVGGVLLWRRSPSPARDA